MTTLIDRLADRLDGYPNKVVDGFVVLLRDSQSSREEMTNDARTWVMEMLTHYTFGWYDAIDTSWAPGKVVVEVITIQSATKAVFTALEALDDEPTAKEVAAATE